MNRVRALLFVWLLVSITAKAQITSVTYQGRLSDGGAPATGVYDLTFTLYSALTGGATVGTSNVVDDVGVTNGVFTVGLNVAASSFDGSDRWLQIAVRPGASTAAYTNLLPRQLITFTPYAIRAANFSGAVAASQLTGSISSNNIGAGSITTTMIAAGAVGSNQLAANAVTTSALADNAVTANKVALGSNWFFTRTIYNPTATPGDFSSNSIAAVGGDRVLVGAPFADVGASNAGAAFLFNTSGVLVATFDNPFPAIDDKFGSAVAAVGGDRVLIGAPFKATGGIRSGVAYLFSTNGTLLATYFPPSPSMNDFFGSAVTAAGGDRIVIGAYGRDGGATDSGAAFVFTTNGTLVRTLTAPSPNFGDKFGSSLAAVGNDWILVGAYGADRFAVNEGTAFLFNLTTGGLLSTFNGPGGFNGDNFGYSVAALGSDRVLIGSHGRDTGALDSGAAYLFNTNGTLLNTFTNPTPAFADNFGYFVAVVGKDRLLIGAVQDDTAALDAGVVYLFNTNGTLLTTLTSPIHATSDHFGRSIAVLGVDQVMIAANQDGTGVPNAGAVHLFSMVTYAADLVAERVRPGSITTASLAEGAVSVDKINGPLLDNQIPDLDASKITSGVFAGSRIPNLDAAKLTSGILDSNRVPNLDSSKIISGVLSVNRIPDLDASKIISGALADARLSGNVALLNRPAQTFTGATNSFSGRVGIGTNNPVAKLHVIGGSDAFLGGGGYIVSGPTTGLNIVMDDNEIMARNSNAISTLFLNANGGTVAIGTASADTNFALHVAGDAAKPGGGSWSVASDQRLKKNIRPLAGALDKLLAIHGVNFEYIDPAKIHELSGERMGLVAQEVEKVFPDWIETGADGYKRVTVRGLEALVVEALRELQQKQDARLADELKRRDAENADLRTRLEKLERLIGRAP